MKKYLGKWKPFPIHEHAPGIIASDVKTNVLTLHWGSDQVACGFQLYKLSDFQNKFSWLDRDSRVKPSSIRWLNSWAWKVSLDFFFSWFSFFSFKTAFFSEHFKVHRNWGIEHRFPILLLPPPQNLPHDHIQPPHVTHRTSPTIMYSLSMWHHRLRWSASKPPPAKGILHTPLDFKVTRGSCSLCGYSE